MPDLNQPVPQLTTDSRKLFLLASWYSCITPGFLLLALFFKLQGGLFYTTSDDGTKWVDWSAEGEFYLIIECILFSCMVSGIVSLFGIRKHGAKVILPKAIAGILLSLGIGFLAKMFQLLSHASFA